MSVYVRQMRRLAQLEERSIGYRFDLDRDPGWERVTATGVHAPRELLVDFGVDVTALGPHAGTFDWVFAASVCRSFIILEECAVAFLARERDTVRASASVASLVTEEEKHIAMFRRYEDQLLAQHDRASFDRWFAPMGTRLRETHGEKLWGVADTTTRHWLFWMNILYFEEFTLYLDERLQEADDVQPTWRQIHRLHRIEETQHVATDEAYLEALDIEDGRLRDLSQMFTFGVLQHFHDSVGISAAIAAVQETGGVTVCPPGAITQRPFFRHVLERPTFRRSRAFAPYLRELARREGP